MTGGHEHKPATKRDIADLREEVIPKIDSVEDRLEGIEKSMATKDDIKSLAKGITGIRELLKGPEGIIDRLEQVEKRVGLKV